jgi:F-type H+-transporting ATPase subunit b
MFLLQLLAQDHGIDPVKPEMVMLKSGLWALGIFIVVVFVLKKFAWGPIVAGLATREDKINESLEKAAAIEQATRELAETNKKTLDEAQRQAQQIITDARESGKAAGDDIVAKAKAEAESQKERFQRELRLETDKARAVLREDAVSLTLEATAKLLGRSMDASDQRRLVEEALHDAENVARN